MRNGHADELVAVESLLDLARSGAIELQLTAAYDRDFARYSDTVGRERREEWLAEASITPKRAPGIFRLDVSIIGGPDVLAGDDDAAFDVQLRELLLESRRRRDGEEDSVAKRYSDIDHLTAHRRSHAVAFVTCDDKTILAYREQLAELGIAVLLPTAALVLLGDAYGIGPSS